MLRGWFQSELARRSGTREPTISTIETGGSKGADFDTLEALADALGVDAGYLISHEWFANRGRG